MKKLTVLLAALVLTSMSTIAAVNIKVDAKKNRIEIQSDKSSIMEVNLNKVDGGSYETNSAPNNNLQINTSNLLSGVYKIEVVSLGEEKTVQFLNIN